MKRQEADKLIWTLNEMLNVIRTVYEEGKLYSDEELQESLAVIKNDLEQFFLNYTRRPISPLGSGTPDDKAFFNALNTFKDHIAALLECNTLTKDSLETKDRGIINNALFKVYRNLIILKMELLFREAKYMACDKKNPDEAKKCFHEFLKTLRKEPVSDALVPVVMDAVMTCIYITEAYEDANPPKKADYLIHKEPYQDGIWESHRSHFQTNEINKAITLCKDLLKCLSRFEDNSDCKEYCYAIALVYSRMARLFVEIEHGDSAVACYRKALDLYLSIWDTGVLDAYECNVMNTIIDLADIYIDIDEYDTAEEVLTEGARLMKSLTERNHTYLDDCGIVYFKMSDFYRILDRSDEDWFYFGQAADIYKKIVAEGEHYPDFEQIRKDYNRIDEPIINEYYVISWWSYLRKTNRLFSGKQE